jgi:predicted trehalose synthase
MALDTDAVAEALARGVAPYLGENMARSAVQAHRDKMALGAALTQEQVEALIGRLGSGLNIFLGRDKSAQVVGELRRAVEALR